jgi:DNA repair protein RecO (recombination protein O)
MDVERAEGVVLRCHPVTETSLIVTWFTREFGKLKTLAKGARRFKSPFRGKLDLFYQDEMLFLWSRRSDLHLLHECYLVRPYVGLRGSVPRLNAASYVSELVEIAMPVEDPNPNVFELLVKAMWMLEKNPSPVLVIWFELQLLEAVGWKPQWKDVGGIGRLLESLGAANLAGAQRVRLTALQVLDVQMELKRFWEVEVGKSPRSRLAS